MEGLTKKIRQELDVVINKGLELLENLTKDRTQFMSQYHEWYTRALPVVRHLLPDRLAEFERLYHLDKRKDIDASTYTIEDYLHGLSVRRGLHELNANAITSSKFAAQVLILKSAASRLDDILSNIQGILQADLFDSEIDAARELKRNGHLRAAGVVVGVVLERHLATVCRNHGVTVRKKAPTISDFDELLKNSDIFDIPTWRWIQRLGDLRNLCCHSKDRDPTADEVQELIDGVDKAIKTIA